MYCETALTAYLVDMIFGEIPFIRHPVVLMGDFIKWFEKHFYKDSVSRGFVLFIALTSLTFTISFYIAFFIQNVWIQGIIASTALASNMLYRSVREIISAPEKIKYLVSRDTEKLTESEICRAAVETYAENLSDGVIAPFLYLLLFGLPGVFVYKAVNTLDSMVGYRNSRYERFGKVSARVDDILNFIPARITAFLIIAVSGSAAGIIKLFKQAGGHSSPNAGWPITAMALALNIKLGGPTSYFGKIKDKPFFGTGRDELIPDDIRRALAFQWRIDLLLLFSVTASLFNL